MSTVTVGHNVRCWTTYEITDVTPDEAEALADIDTDRAVAVFRQIMEAGRTREYVKEYDDNPTMFEEADQPAVIDFTPDDEEQP